MNMGNTSSYHQLPHCLRIRLISKQQFIMAHNLSPLYYLFCQLLRWGDGTFQIWTHWFDVLARVYPAVLHIAKSSIMLYTVALLLHCLLRSWSRGTNDLPRPVVHKAQEKGKLKAERVKLGLPLTLLLAFI